MEMKIEKATVGRILHLEFTREEMALNAGECEGKPEEWAGEALRNLAMPFIPAFANPNPMDRKIFAHRLDICNFPCRSHYKSKDPLSAWRFTGVKADMWFAGKRFFRRDDRTPGEDGRVICPWGGQK